MGHVLVLAYLIILIVGVWAAVAVKQAQRASASPVLGRLFNYIISFNVMVFAYLVVKYLFTNIIGEDPAGHPGSITAILTLAVFAIETAIAWTTLQLVYSLQSRPFSSRLVRLFIIVVALFGVSFAIGTTLILQDGLRRWLMGTYFALVMVATSVMLSSFVVLAVGRHSKLGVSQRSPVRRLGWFFLCGFVPLVVSAAFHRSIGFIISSAALLWMNCVPLIWLRSDFPNYHGERTPGGSDEALRALAVKHGVTERELEVMRLIVQGRSNKEIEDLMCISFSTVKNHAYSIYKKLGVSSRAQLIHLVMASADGRTKARS